MPRAVQLRVVWFTIRFSTLRGVKVGEAGSDCSRIQGGISQPFKTGMENLLR
jgi:hypothetical protein